MNYPFRPERPRFPPRSGRSLTSVPKASWPKKASTAAMSLLLLVVSALHILILILLFVATLDKSWWTLPGKESLNLWYDCTWNNDTKTWACSNVSENGWLKAVQVLMVLSLILCCLSFILFMFQLYTMRRGGLFYATGLCQLCTSKHCPSPPLIPQELSRREVGCVKMLGALRMGLSQKKTIFNTPRAREVPPWATSLPPGIAGTCSFQWLMIVVACAYESSGNLELQGAGAGEGGIGK
uniref:Epithelial membrane protein 3 (MAM blood group) n=4 Tax=Catarrhini TaxID=9526 RepID=A0A7N9CWD2_MACFA